MNSFGFDFADMETLQNILSAYPEVETAILYGSRATGRFRAGSDVDLVLTGKNLSDRTVLDIRADVDDSSLPYLFDIAALDDVADENLKREIETTGKVLFQHPRSTATS